MSWSKSVLVLCIALLVGAGSRPSDQSGASSTERRRDSDEQAAQAESGRRRPRRVIPVRMIDPNKPASRPAPPATGLPVPQEPPIAGARVPQARPTTETRLPQARPATGPRALQALPAAPARSPRRHIPVRMVSPGELNAPVRTVDAPITDPSRATTGPADQYSATPGSMRVPLDRSRTSLPNGRYPRTRARHRNGSNGPGRAYARDHRVCVRTIRADLGDRAPRERTVRRGLHRTWPSRAPWKRP